MTYYFEARHAVALTDPSEVEAVGLPWNGRGYGLVLCQGRDGARVTFATGSLDFHDHLVGVVLKQPGGYRTTPDAYEWQLPSWPPLRGVR
jgi:hypothetical protein